MTLFSLRSSHLRSSHLRSSHVYFLSLILFTLGSVMGCGALSDPLPQGEEGPAAERIADRLLKAINAPDFEVSEGAQWSFRGYHYLWHRGLERARVQLEDTLFVYLDLNGQRGWAIEDDERVSSDDERDYVQKAIKAFNNDSFWAFAPFKIRDPGTSRALVKSDDWPHDSLLVFYKTGGSTPGDHYLWHLNDEGRPIAWQMWVSIIPIGGVKSSWEGWRQTESRAWVSITHRLSAGLSLNIESLKVTHSFESLGVSAPRLVGEWPKTLSH